MENISSLSAKVQVQPVVTEKTEKKEEKTPKQVENGEEKMALALSGLAAAGLAALAIKKGKVKDARKIIKNSADDMAKAAANQIKNGASVNAVKKEATKNLSHEGKKVVKEAMSSALDSKLAQQAMARQNAIKNSTVAKKAPSAVKSLKQGTKNATEEVLQGKIQTAKTVASEAAESAKKLKDVAVANPTHKNKKIAQYAHNQAETAKTQALKVEEKSTKLIQEAREKAAKKAEALAKAQASPNYAAGQVKMQENSVKAAAKSVKRKAARDVAKPGYQRALAKFQGYSPEKLQGIVSSSKSSPVEKLVAGDLLAALK